MFSFLCLHFIRPEPCNPTTVSLFGHAFLGLDSISYLGSSASCRGESCLLTVQVYGRLDISSVSSSLRISFLSCTILSLRELLHVIRRSTNWTCLILVERRNFLISHDAHILWTTDISRGNELLQWGSHHRLLFPEKFI